MEIIKDLLSARASKSGVALEIALGEPLPNLDADPDQLQQVLVNLVLNAIDACDRGGRVELRAAARGAGLQLEIIDDGSGIPHDIQPQIFDPFFTTKKRGQGTGLGLWVVAQLVRAHAAEIEVESSPGVGTTVRLTWPVVT
jgi:signal transduction histidine kinase